MRRMSDSGDGWAAPTPSSPTATPMAEPAPPPWGQLPPVPPKPGVVPLRPLTIGELLDGSVGVLRRYPRPVLGLAAALSVVATALNVTLTLTVLRPVLTLDELTGRTHTTGQTDGLVGGALLGSVASGLVSALATLVLTGVLTAIAGKAVLGEPMTLGQAWAQVRPALGRLTLLALVTGLLVYGPLLAGLALAVWVVSSTNNLGTGMLVFLPGAAIAVYAYTRLCLAPCAVVLEKASVRTSLRRSDLLVRRARRRVLGVLVLAMVVGFVVSQVVQVPLLFIGLARHGIVGRSLTDLTTTAIVLSYIGKGITQTVVRPFTAGVRALLYVDRRMRAEGLDVALTAAAASRSA